MYVVLIAGINYKDLLSGRCDIKNVLGPILDANNVAVFAKYSANFVDKVRITRHHF